MAAGPPFSRMNIRFLRTTASDSPEYPFQTGQIVDLPMSARVRQWIEDGAAVVVVPERETTMLGGPEEKATLRQPKPRGRR